MNSPAAVMSNNGSDYFEFGAFAVPYQIDSDTVLLPCLIRQLGLAHEWSGLRSKKWLRQAH